MPLVDDEGHLTGEIMDLVQFRDLPPGGLTLSRATQVAEAVEVGEIRVSITGGAVLADDFGDFILAIELPDDLAATYRVAEDPPTGWPFREYWLSPEVANQLRYTLTVDDSDDGEEVRHDLVGK